MISKRPITPLVAGAAAALIVVGADARAQSGNAGALRGVAHQLYVTRKAERVPAAPTDTDMQARATLTALIRISDHARESNFFGTILATVVGVAMGEETPEQKVWEDKTCHQDRGLPRLVVTGINGLIKEGDREIAVSAQPRRIGKHLPSDEIVVSQSLAAGRDERGTFVVQEGRTLASRVGVRLKLYTTPCTITS